MKIYLILIFIIILSSCGTKKVTYDIIKDVLDKDSVIVVGTSMTSLDSITELPLQLQRNITYTCPFSINSFYIYTDRYSL
jgi:hypothetical protein